MSALQQATSRIASIASTEGCPDTAAFLDVCRLVLAVVEKLGNAFFPVRADISGNIQRLETRAQTDSARYVHLFDMVHDEVAAGKSGESSSCTKGLLWLKRAMEFVLAIVRSTQEHPNKSSGEVVSTTYKATLMQFHGYISSTAFTLAFNFVPTREYFVDSIGSGSAEETSKQMLEFVAAFAPVLQEVHQFLVKHGLDDPTKV